MDTLTCEIVRPDKLLYKGEAANVILVARAGELGVFPKHGAEISALGDGVMRIYLPDGSQRRVVIMGGYAEVANDRLIVLATHARNADDIEPETVKRTREKAAELRDSLDANDHRRAYYDEKIRWCDLLLTVASKSGVSK